MTDLTNLRIFVCTAPISMSLSFDRLMGVAQEVFAKKGTGTVPSA